MDQKKKVAKMKKIVLAAAIIFNFQFSIFNSVSAQDVDRFQLMDNRYEYDSGSDSITVFFNVLDDQGVRRRDFPVNKLMPRFVLKEDGTVIPEGVMTEVRTGLRIPADYTFSVLVDLSIPYKGKEQIAELVGSLVESAHDSCVFLSFFGDNVGSTQLVTRENYPSMRTLFGEKSKDKYLYSALYAKLSEFESKDAPMADKIKIESDYKTNRLIAERARKNPDKNILFVFTEGNRLATLKGENFVFLDIADYQSDEENLVPTVYAFYYTEDGNDPKIGELLEAICNPDRRDEQNGEYMPADNMKQVMSDFERVVSEKSYDYAFTYRAFDDKTYTGKTLFEIEWDGVVIGDGVFSIGSPERPWPIREETVGGYAVKCLVALLVAVLVTILFLFIIKVLVPWGRSRAFERKYYKVYVPEENVRRRICHFCGMEIEPGQTIVVRCKHIMHVGCWRQNGYRCAEYGQNCKEGIQVHVHWKELISKSLLRENRQTLSGVGAALIAWVVYELVGRGGFKAISQWIATFSLSEGTPDSFLAECASRTSAFLMIGLLLGFSLSLVFRYNDEYRTKDWKTLLKILGLSLLTGLAGMLAFAIGAICFCLLVSISDTTYIPWWASFPAYAFFSLSVAAVLSWKTSVPIKSALLGGGLSSLIGFIVLLFTTSSTGWMNMLLNFVIYGGGLGASLVTVRMLSEHYFLVVQNGIRAGLRIPIHKWMNATGGGNKVSIGMTGECEIQMNWEKSNKVAKEHARLYVDREKNLPMIKPMATGVQYNNRMELSVGKSYVMSNGDIFKIGDTIFKYDESEKV